MNPFPGLFGAPLQSEEYTLGHGKTTSIYYNLLQCFRGATTSHILRMRAKTVSMRPVGADRASQHIVPIVSATISATGRASQNSAIERSIAARVVASPRSPEGGSGSRV